MSATREAEARIDSLLLDALTDSGGLVADNARLRRLLHHQRHHIEALQRDLARLRALLRRQS